VIWWWVEFHSRSRCPMILEELASGCWGAIKRLPCVRDLFFFRLFGLSWVLESIVLCGDGNGWGRRNIFQGFGF
jgi:hypothetical protein